MKKASRISWSVFPREASLSLKLLHLAQIALRFQARSEQLRTADLPLIEAVSAERELFRASP